MGQVGRGETVKGEAGRRAETRLERPGMPSSVGLGFIRRH